MRYEVQMRVDGTWYTYGTYGDRDVANEVAMMVRDTRDVDVWVEEVE